MIKIISIVLLFFCVSCNSSTDKKQTDTNTSDVTISEEDVDMVLVDDPEEEGSKMILGKTTCKALQSELFNEWYVESHNNHALDTNTLSKIEPLLKDVRIKVFMGTWCEDSQREVPALYKILDHINYDYKNLELFAVSRDKDTPEGYEKGFNIEYVPTIIFIKNGNELGRIVEYTQESLEKDMYAILSGADYKHAYAD